MVYSCGAGAARAKFIKFRLASLSALPKDLYLSEKNSLWNFSLVGRGGVMNEKTPRQSKFDGEFCAKIKRTPPLYGKVSVFYHYKYERALIRLRLVFVKHAPQALDRENGKGELQGIG